MVVSLKGVSKRPLFASLCAASSTAALEHVAAARSAEPGGGLGGARVGPPLVLSYKLSVRSCAPSFPPSLLFVKCEWRATSWSEAPSSLMVSGASSRSSGIGLGRCPRSRSRSAPAPLSEDEGSSEEEERDGQAGGGLATSGAGRSNGAEAEAVATKKKDTAAATAARIALKVLLEKSVPCFAGLEPHALASPLLKAVLIQYGEKFGPGYISLDDVLRRFDALIHSSGWEALKHRTAIELPRLMARREGGEAREGGSAEGGWAGSSARGGKGSATGGGKRAGAGGGGNGGGKGGEEGGAKGGEKVPAITEESLSQWHARSGPHTPRAGVCGAVSFIRLFALHRLPGLLRAHHRAANIPDPPHPVRDTKDKDKIPFGLQPWVHTPDTFRACVKEALEQFVAVPFHFHATPEQVPSFHCCAAVHVSYFYAARIVLPFIIPP